MRLPTSTIVMAVVVCVPFGLAIRDTLKHPAPDAEADDQDPAEAEAETEAPSNLAASEETQREIMRQADQEEERARTARKTALGQLLGAEPATLGPAFAGLALGAGDRGAFVDVVDRLRTTETTLDYDLDLLGDGKIRAVEITAAGDDRDASCEALQARVTDGWGAGEHAPTLGGPQWQSTVLGQRATFDEAACSVTVERFAPVETYVTKDRSSVIPVWAVGGPLTALQAAISHATVDGDTVSWEALGVGTGLGATELTATVAGGKIRSLSASTAMTARTAELLEERLTQLYGAPTDRDGRRVWTRKPGIVLDATDPANSVLTVGAPRN